MSRSCQWWLGKLVTRGGGKSQEGWAKEHDHLRELPVVWGLGFRGKVGGSEIRNSLVRANGFQRGRDVLLDRSLWGDLGREVGGRGGRWW